MIAWYKEFQDWLNYSQIILDRRGYTYSTRTDFTVCSLATVSLGQHSLPTK